MDNLSITQHLQRILQALTFLVENPQETLEEKNELLNNCLRSVSRRVFQVWREKLRFSNAEGLWAEFGEMSSRCRAQIHHPLLFPLFADVLKRCVECERILRDVKTENLTPLLSPKTIEMRHYEQQMSQTLLLKMQKSKETVVKTAPQTNEYFQEVLTLMSLEDLYKNREKNFDLLVANFGLEEQRIALQIGKRVLSLAEGPSLVPFREAMIYFSLAIRHTRKQFLPGHEEVDRTASRLFVFLIEQILCQDEALLKDESSPPPSHFRKAASVKRFLHL